MYSSGASLVYCSGAYLSATLLSHLIDIVPTILHELYARDYHEKEPIEAVLWRWARMFCRYKFISPTSSCRSVFIFLRLLIFPKFDIPLYYI